MSGRAVLTFRVFVGAAGALVGLSFLLGEVERPLAIAVLVFGLLVLVHVGVDLAWDRLTGPGVAVPPSPDPNLFQLAGAFVATPGAVLGLVFAFSRGFGLAVKVGVVSLAIDVIVAFMLSGMLTEQPAIPERARHFRAYFFNLALWGLSLGLLCIAFALLYR